MTNKNIYRNLGSLDPALIAMAAPAEKAIIQKKNTWVRWASLAACLFLIVGAVIVVGCIVLFKQLGNKVFKISLNDLPYNKALAPGEYKIDSSMFPDCQESFTIILSTKKGEDGTGHYVQFKLMPNWTLFEGNRALSLNGECSDELQINTETYKIRTLKGTMEFKIDLKD